MMIFREENSRDCSYRFFETDYIASPPKVGQLSTRDYHRNISQPRVYTTISGKSISTTLFNRLFEYYDLAENLFH